MAPGKSNNHSSYSNPKSKSSDSKSSAELAADSALSGSLALPSPVIEVTNDQIQDKLSASGMFKNISVSALQDIGQIARQKYELGQLMLLKGSLENPEVLLRYQKLQQEVEVKHKKLISSLGWKEDGLQAKHLEWMFQDFQTKGFCDLSAYLLQKQAETTAQEITRKSNRSFAIHLWDNLLEGSKALPKVLESVLNIGAGTTAAAGGFIWGLFTGKPPSATAISNYAAVIRFNQEFFNKYIWGGSAFGSDQDFAAMGDVTACMAVNPLGHLGKAVFEPILGVTELAYSHAVLNICNGLNGTSMTYADLKKLQVTDPAFKLSYNLFRIGEGALSLAVLVASGGSVVSPLLTSVAFSSLTALAEELLDNKTSFQKVRFFENLVSGTAQSLFFMAGMARFAPAYIKLRNGALPNSADDLAKLRLVYQDKYLHLEKVAKEAKIISWAINTVDGHSDLSDAMTSIDRIENWNNWDQVSGACLLIAVSGYDVSDSGSIDAHSAMREYLPSYENKEIVFEHEGKLVKGRFFLKKEKDKKQQPDEFHAADFETIQHLYHYNKPEDSLWQQRASYYDYKTELSVLPVAYQDDSAAMLAWKSSLAVHENTHHQNKGLYLPQIDEELATIAQEEDLAEKGWALEYEELSLPTLIRATPLGKRSLANQRKRFISQFYQASAIELPAVESSLQFNSLAAASIVNIEVPADQQQSFVRMSGALNKSLQSLSNPQSPTIRGLMVPDLRNYEHTVIAYFAQLVGISLGVDKKVIDFISRQYQGLFWAIVEPALFQNSSRSAEQQMSAGAHWSLGQIKLIGEFAEISDPQIRISLSSFFATEFNNLRAKLTNLRSSSLELEFKPYLHVMMAVLEVYSIIIPQQTKNEKKDLVNSLRAFGKSCAQILDLWRAYDAQLTTVIGYRNSDKDVRIQAERLKKLVEITKEMKVPFPVVAFVAAVTKAELASLDRYVQEQIYLPLTQAREQLRQKLQGQESDAGAIYSELIELYSIWEKHQGILLQNLDLFADYLFAFEPIATVQEHFNLIEQVEERFRLQVRRVIISNLGNFSDKNLIAIGLVLPLFLESRRKTIATPAERKNVSLRLNEALASSTLEISDFELDRLAQNLSRGHFHAPGLGSNLVGKLLKLSDPRMSTVAHVLNYALDSQEKISDDSHRRLCAYISRRIDIASSRGQSERGQILLFVLRCIPCLLVLGEVGRVQELVKKIDLKKEDLKLEERKRERQLRIALHAFRFLQYFFSKAAFAATIPDFILAKMQIEAEPKTVSIDPPNKFELEVHQTLQELFTKGNTLLLLNYLGYAPFELDILGIKTVELGKGRKNSSCEVRFVVECDGDNFHFHNGQLIRAANKAIDRSSLLGSNLVREEVLQGLGVNVVRIFHSEWLTCTTSSTRQSLIYQAFKEAGIVEILGTDAEVFAKWGPKPEPLPPKIRFLQQAELSNLLSQDRVLEIIQASSVGESNDLIDLAQQTSQEIGHIHPFADSKKLLTALFLPCNINSIPMMQLVLVSIDSKASAAANLLAVETAASVWEIIHREAKQMAVVINCSTSNSRIFAQRIVLEVNKLAQAAGKAGYLMISSPLGTDGYIQFAAEERLHSILQEVGNDRSLISISLSKEPVQEVVPPQLTVVTEDVIVSVNTLAEELRVGDDTSSLEISASAVEDSSNQVVNNNADLSINNVEPQVLTATSSALELPISEQFSPEAERARVLATAVSELNSIIPIPELTATQLQILESLIKPGDFFYRIGKTTFAREITQEASSVQLTADERQKSFKEYLSIREYKYKSAILVREVGFLALRKRILDLLENNQFNDAVKLALCFSYTTAYSDVLINILSEMWSASAEKGDPKKALEIFKLLFGVYDPRYFPAEAQRIIFETVEKIYEKPGSSAQWQEISNAVKDSSNFNSIIGRILNLLFDISVHAHNLHLAQSSLTSLINFVEQEKEGRFKDSKSSQFIISLIELKVRKYAVLFHDQVGTLEFCAGILKRVSKVFDTTEQAIVAELLEGQFEKFARRPEARERNKRNALIQRDAFLLMIILEKEELIQNYRKAVYVPLASETSSFIYTLNFLISERKWGDLKRVIAKWKIHPGLLIYGVENQFQYSYSSGCAYEAMQIYHEANRILADYSPWQREQRLATYRRFSTAANNHDLSRKLIEERERLEEIELESTDPYSCCHVILPQIFEGLGRGILGEADCFFSVFSDPNVSLSQKDPGYSTIQSETIAPSLIDPRYYFDNLCFADTNFVLDYDAAANSVYLLMPTVAYVGKWLRTFILLNAEKVLSILNGQGLGDSSNLENKNNLRIVSDFVLYCAAYIYVCRAYNLQTDLNTDKFSSGLEHSLNLLNSFGHGIENWNPLTREVFQYFRATDPNNHLQYRDQGKEVVTNSAQADVVEATSLLALPNGSEIIQWFTDIDSQSVETSDQRTTEAIRDATLAAARNELAHFVRPEVIRPLTPGPLTDLQRKLAGLLTFQGKSNGPLDHFRKRYQDMIRASFSVTLPSGWVDPHFPTSDLTARANRAKLLAVATAALTVEGAAQGLFEKVLDHFRQDRVKEGIEILDRFVKENNAFDICIEIASHVPSLFSGNLEANIPRIFSIFQVVAKESYESDHDFARPGLISDLKTIYDRPNDSSAWQALLGNLNSKNQFPSIITFASRIFSSFFKVNNNVEQAAECVSSLIYFCKNLLNDPDLAARVCPVIFSRILCLAVDFSGDPKTLRLCAGLLQELSAVKTDENYDLFAKILNGDIDFTGTEIEILLDPRSEDQTLIFALYVLMILGRDDLINQLHQKICIPLNIRNASLNTAVVFFISENKWEDLLRLIKQKKIHPARIISEVNEKFIKMINDDDIYSVMFAYEQLLKILAAYPDWQTEEAKVAYLKFPSPAIAHNKRLIDLVRIAVVAERQFAQSEVNCLESKVPFVNLIFKNLREGILQQAADDIGFVDFHLKRPEHESGLPGHLTLNASGTGICEIDPRIWFANLSTPTQRAFIECFDSYVSEINNMPSANLVARWIEDFLVKVRPLAEAILRNDTAYFQNQGNKNTAGIVAEYLFYSAAYGYLCQRYGISLELDSEEVSITLDRMLSRLAEIGYPASNWHPLTREVFEHFRTTESNNPLSTRSEANTLDSNMMRQILSNPSATVEVRKDSSDKITSVVLLPSKIEQKTSALAEIVLIGDKFATIPFGAFKSDGLTFSLAVRFSLSDLHSQEYSASILSRIQGNFISIEMQVNIAGEEETVRSFNFLAFFNRDIEFAGFLFFGLNGFESEAEVVKYYALVWKQCAENLTAIIENLRSALLK